MIPAATKNVVRPIWKWARGLGGVAILAILVWQLGTGPFLEGVRLIDSPAIGAALAVGLLTTVCCAWRWSLVAAGLGVRLPLRHAVEAYYRSQFLNATLPGGVVGDIHRAVRHGMDVGDMGLGVRAVVLERLGGQTVQVAIGMIALFTFPSPVQSSLVVLGIGVAAVGFGVVLLHRTLSTMAPGQFVRRTLIGVVLTSAVVLAGHLAIFLLAARTAGATAPLSLLLPLTLLALLAMALPVNIAGWGLREGVAAWAFGAAGLTATQGVSTAVTYGVLALIATLPGAILLMRYAIPRRLGTE